MTPTSHDVTQLLMAWNESDKEALDRLIPLVYEELHRLARGYMRKERANQTLQTTAILHEAYLNLIDASQVKWRNRAHFFGVAARLMRRILVTFARVRNSQKRGDGARQVSLNETTMIDQGLDEDLTAVDEALSALSQFDARKAQVVEMRFFGGLTEEEIAAVLGVSPKTVRRDWRLARTWLRGKLCGERRDGA